MSQLIYGGDIARRFNWKQSIAPSSNASTVTGSEVDVTDAATMVTIVVNVGSVSAGDGSNYNTFTVTQATATGGSFGAPDADQYDLVNSWDGKINATGEANTIYLCNFRLKAGYPFIKVVMTKTGTQTIVYSATVFWEGNVKPTYST
jgi:hypothetical protein